MEYEAKVSKTENGKYIKELMEKGKLRFCPQCQAPTTKRKDADGKDGGVTRFLVPPAVSVGVGCVRR